MTLHAIQSVFQELGRGFVRLLYPGLCSVCHCPLPPEQERFCTACRNALISDSLPSCPRCAATIGPFALASLKDGCTRCGKHTFRFERAIRLGPYEGLLRDVIVRLKHLNADGLAELVGKLWAEHLETKLREARADVVVPIPLHWRRRLLRGYNQSLALARGVAARLSLPLRPSWLRRVHHTPIQPGQAAGARSANVHGAFQATRKVTRGASVLLIDDVMTTGSTVDEAAAALRRAGADRAVVAVLARAL
jgi:ComF family protein